MPLETLHCECGQDFEGSPFLLVPECEDCREAALMARQPAAPPNYFDMEPLDELLRHIEQGPRYLHTDTEAQQVRAHQARLAREAYDAQVGEWSNSLGQMGNTTAQYNAPNNTWYNVVTHQNPDGSFTMTSNTIQENNGR